MTLGTFTFLLDLFCDWTTFQSCKHETSLLTSFHYLILSLTMCFVISSSTVYNAEVICLNDIFIHSTRVLSSNPWWWNNTRLIFEAWKITNQLFPYNMLLELRQRMHQLKSSALSSQWIIMNLDTIIKSQRYYMNCLVIYLICIVKII